MTQEALAADRFRSLRNRSRQFRDLAESELDGSYRFAMVLLGDAAEAEDATHDAFVRAWRGWDSLREPEKFRSWFSQILVNVCRDRLRRRVRAVSMAEVPDTAVPDRFRSLSYDPEREQLLQALGSLPAEQRTVVVLRFYADQPLDEIARLTASRVGTVKSRLHHALRALRAAYDAIERREGGR